MAATASCPHIQRRFSLRLRTLLTAAHFAAAPRTERCARAPGVKHAVRDAHAEALQPGAHAHADRRQRRGHLSLHGSAGGTPIAPGCPASDAAVTQLMMNLIGGATSQAASPGARQAPTAPGCSARRRLGRAHMRKTHRLLCTSISLSSMGPIADTFAICLWRGEGPGRHYAAHTRGACSAADCGTEAAPHAERPRGTT